MKYEEVYDNLIQSFPDFCIDQEDRKLQYIVASYFIRFLIDKYNNKDLDTLKKGFQFIENLHFSKDIKVRELATIGYLENMLGTQFSRTDGFLELLGPQSKREWLQLNRFWNDGCVYECFVEKPVILSCDLSTIYDVKVVDNDLYIKVDCLFYLRDGNATAMAKDCINNCLIKVKDYKIISEKVDDCLIQSKGRKQMEKYANKKKLSLYMSFTDFLKSTNIGVQEFQCDYGEKTFNIIGYDEDEDNSIWCSLGFQFSNICLYWTNTHKIGNC